MTHKKKIKKFHVLKCWMFSRAEVVVFAPNVFFSAVISLSIFGHQNPGSVSVPNKNRSETLQKMQLYLERPSKSCLDPGTGLVLVPVQQQSVQNVQSDVQLASQHTSHFLEQDISA
jgi:hypothetical protein